MLLEYASWDTVVTLFNTAPQAGLQELQQELHSAVAEGEAWKVAATKLDRRLKSKELEERVYNALEVVR